MRCVFENEEMLESKIDEIVNFKIRMFDEEFSFGPTLGFNSEYLKKIHKFLFSDFYEGCGEFRLEIDEQEEKRINFTVSALADIASNFSSDLYPDFMDCVEYLKDIQAFPDGNKRTIYAYLKVLIGAYNLPIELGQLGAKESPNLSEGQIRLK